MRIDLNFVGYKAAIDVRNVRKIRLQVSPAEGNPTGGVVEIKRAFDSDSQSPSVSFTTTQTLDLTGDTILEIDVTDQGWLHIFVTTAASGDAVNVDYMTSGIMAGRSLVRRVDLDALGVRDSFGAQPAYKSFVIASPVQKLNAITPGVLLIKQSIGDGKVVSFAASSGLTLNGSLITDIDSRNAGTIHTVCTTAQAGLLVDLYWYLRDETADDSIVATAGTVFPLNPYDAQAFTRTDLEGETYHWDATRSKWLGELVVLSGGYPSTLAAGSSIGARIGDVSTSTSRGILFPNDMTIVGCTLFNAVTASATVEWREASSTVGTILTFVSARGGSDMTLNFDFDGDAVSPHKYPVFLCTVGSPASLNNPIVQIYMRRRAT